LKNIQFQSALHYEMSWVGRHVLLSWVGCFALYLVQCFPAAYIHAMHRTSTYLGQWTRIEGRVSVAFYNQWCDHLFWHRGVIVRHGKGGNDLYRADGLSNAAEPGNSSQSRFYVSPTKHCFLIKTITEETVPSRMTFIQTCNTS
jgi:hypothetical protein